MNLTKFKCPLKSQPSNNQTFSVEKCPKTKKIPRNNSPCIYQVGMSAPSSLQSACVDLFKSTFGPGGCIKAGYAPGRVNLIGEHTDYNNGFVFPMALADLGTVAVGRATDKGEISILTSAEVSPNSFLYRSGSTALENVHQWARYVVGVVKCFEEVAGVTASLDPVSYTHLTLPTIYSV